MTSLLVARVKRRISELAKSAERDPDAHSLEHRTLTEKELRAAERRLGFGLPTPLRLLYLQVGNGGYGPSYGLLGLVGGALQEDGCDAVTMYESNRKTWPEDPHWRWPEKLLPVVHLGCAMFFCVDCSDERGMVLWFEPNPHEDGEAWDDSFIPLNRSFEDLMSGWARGEKTTEVLEAAGR